MFSWSRRDFPDDFIFGAATAAYQIEGGQGAETGRGSSIWDSFAATPGRVAKQQSGQQACDHYNRWPEDLDLMQRAGFDAYRFSFAWPRLFPEGRGAPNEIGFDFYDRLIDAMLARGLRPFATLYHWDLPSALQDRGGWTNRDIAYWFADYAAAVAARFGDRLDRIATLNEPWCIAYLGHFTGVMAPGQRDIRAAARAMHLVLLAHAEAVQALRSVTRTKLGIVLNFEEALPGTASASAQQAADLWDALMNRWFLDALVGGSYPEPVLAELAAHLPDAWQDDMAQIAQPLDWLGVNYYTRSAWVADAARGFPPVRQVPIPHLPQSDMGWAVAPEGLAEVLRRVHRKAPQLPLFVTENGMAEADRLEDGGVHDAARLAYFDAHLRVCLELLAEGLPLKGYFAWSLLDNYEWAEGYAKRFGLVRVDYQTFERLPKASFQAFATALQS